MIGIYIQRLWKDAEMTGITQNKRKNVIWAVAPQIRITEEGLVCWRKEKDKSKSNKKS